MQTVDSPCRNKSLCLFLPPHPLGIWEDLRIGQNQKNWLEVAWESSAANRQFRQPEVSMLWDAHHTLNRLWGPSGAVRLKWRYLQLISGFTSTIRSFQKHQKLSAEGDPSCRTKASLYSIPYTLSGFILPPEYVNMKKTRYFKMINYEVDILIKWKQEHNYFRRIILSNPALKNTHTHLKFGDLSVKWG